MPRSEHSTIQGVLTLELRDGGGALVEACTVHNLVTSGGKSLLARLLAGNAPGAVGLVIGVGEGKKGPAASDVALESKVAEAEATITDPAVDADHVRVIVEANVTAGGTDDKPLALTEAGILIRIGNDKIGVLFNRVTFPVINKGPNMTLLLSWELTF